MIKIKPVIICASIAFVLSFFTALIAKTGVPVSLLKAVIFAAVFGGLAVGIQIVYDKFLSEGEAPAPEVSQQPKTVGGKVDLVVTEEDLPGDKDSPSFALDSTRHVLKPSDIGIKAENSRPAPVASRPQPAAPAATESAKPAPAPAASEAASAPPAQNSGFVPMNLAGGGEASGGAQQAPQAAGGGSSDELPELDEFPGLGADDGVGASPASSGGADVIEDSDFAEEGSKQPTSQTEFPDGKIADAKDASLMAEAIRTVLMKEE